MGCIANQQESVKKRYEGMEESEKGACKKMCLLLDAIEEDRVGKGVQQTMNIIAERMVRGIRTLRSLLWRNNIQ